MSIAAAPVRTLTIEQWYELYRDYEGGRCELVRGHAIMTPTEAFRNIDAIRRLLVLLDRTLDSWVPYTNCSIQLGDDPAATVRIPDVTILPSDLDGSRWLARAQEVPLVAEVVSVSSVETDWVTKRAEYAIAGIPNYLIVDVRTPGEPRLWLFDQIAQDASAENADGGGSTDPSAAGGAATYPRYADPTGDGLSVTIRIPGAEPITICAADLV